MIKHTPTPWEVLNFDNDKREKAVICSGDRPIASIHCGFVEDPQANAEFIVRAVNAHNELVEALKYALNFINEGCPEYDQIHTRIKIEQALTKAGA